MLRWRLLSGGCFVLTIPMSTPAAPCGKCCQPICHDCEHLVEGVRICFRCEQLARMPEFSIWHCISIGWAAMTKNMGTAVLAALIIFLLDLPGGIPYLGVVYGLFLNFVFKAGQSYIGIRLADTELMGTPPPELGNLFDGFRRYLSLLGATWLYLLIVLVSTLPVWGIIFWLEESGLVDPPALFFPVLVGLLIPVVYVMLRLFFVCQIIMCEGKGTMDAFYESWRITKGRVLSLFGLIVVVGLILLLGALLFVVGLLFAIPVVMAACGAAYRMMSRPAEKECAQTGLPVI